MLFFIIFQYIIKIFIINSIVKQVPILQRNVTNTKKSDIIDKNDANIEEKNVPYNDITNEFNNNKKYIVKKQKYFVDNSGNRYNVDGKYVVLEPTKRKIEVANLIGQVFDGEIYIIPIVNYPKNIKTPDYNINKAKYDLKTLTENNKNTIYNAIHKQKMQANNFIIDISKNEMSQANVDEQIEKIYKSRHTEWVRQIVIIKDDKISSTIFTC